MSKPEAHIFAAIFETLKSSLGEPPGKPHIFPPFVEYAWKTFDVQTVLDILSSSKESYAAHRNLLFAGLATWLLRPGRNRMRRQAMLLVALQHLRQAEETGRTELPKDALLGDFYGRAFLSGRGFYADFYYPIGGIAALNECPTIRSFVKRLRKVSEDVYTVAAVMKVFDYRVRAIPFDKSWYDITENMGWKAIPLVCRPGLLRGHCGKDEARSRWEAYRDRASFIYAASTIPCGDGGSLLDLICSGKILEAPKREVVEPWAKRSRYAHNTLIKRLKGELAKNIHHHIPMDGDQEAPQEPEFSAASISHIKSLFCQKLTLEKRRQPTIHRTKAAD